MGNLLSTIFGASYKTSAIGIFEGILIAALAVMKDEGIPTTWSGWGIFAAGVLRAWFGLETKDKGVSNAERPKEAAIVDLPATDKSDVPHRKITS